jgi:hypothetical protein
LKFYRVEEVIGPKQNIETLGEREAEEEGSEFQN